MLDRLVELVNSGLSERTLRRLSRTRLADAAMRQAQRLLVDTWPCVRDGSSPTHAVKLDVWQVVARVAGCRAELAGDPRKAPVDLALSMLAMTRINLVEPALLSRSLLAFGPAEHRFAFYRSTAGALVTHAERSRELVCLDAGLVLAAMVLTNYPGDAVGHDFMVRACKLRFAIAADPRDEEKVVQHTRASVEQTPDGAVDLVRRLCQLGEVLTARALRLRDKALADEAAQVLRRAAALAGTNRLMRAAVVGTLVQALIAGSAEATGVEEMDEALALSRELQTIPETAPLHAHLRQNLARLLALRFARRNDPDVLEETVTAYRELCAAAPEGTPVHGQWSGHLGRHLLYRTFTVEDPTALSEAKGLLFEAARETGAEALDKEVLEALVTVVAQTTEGSADVAALDEAIEVLVEATEPGRRHARTPEVLAGVSRLMGVKGRHAPGTDLAHRSEGYARRAMDAAGADSSRDTTYQSVLGAALIDRHLREGHPEILDEGVDLARKAVFMGDPDRREHVDNVNQLAHALYMRSQLTNHGASLDEAITLMRQQVVSRVRHGPARDVAVANLAVMLTARARMTSNPADAGEARDILTAEIERVSRDHVSRLNMQELLGAALHIIAGLEHDDHAQEESERYLELVVEAPDLSAELRRRAQSSLSSMLLRRFDRDPSVVDRAVDLCRASLEGVRAGGPDRHVLLTRLGIALVMRGALGDLDHDMVESKAVFDGLLSDPTSPPITRVISAASIGRIAQITDDPDAALAALRQGITLLPMLTRQAIDRADQEWVLRPVHNLSRMAAAAAIRCGEPAQAVELLEHGRAVLAAQTLETRSPLTELASLEPELATRLERLRVELDQSSGIDEWQYDLHATATLGHRADHRHRLVREWTEALAEVRTRAGFADFLQPPQFDRLRRVADDGPVVILNTDTRCEALLLTRDGVHVCPLPELSTEDAEQVVRLLFGERTGANESDPLADGMIANVLDWLWHVVAEPVMDALALAGPPQGHWPRIWWCPTGPLSFLPVHAAASVDGQAVLDRAISSYTPTLSALLQARARPRPQTRKTLALAVSNRAGLDQLPGARRETEVLARLAHATVLIDEQATFDALRQELASHNCVHFACHGVQDTDDPSTGRLLLTEGQVRVTDIARLRLDSAYLAFLSACETAVGGSALPDEAVHIAGALHLAGFRNVIGTMWQIADEPAATLATRVYQALNQGGDTAHALHDANRSLRAELPDRPSVWASHIHIGP